MNDPTKYTEHLMMNFEQHETAIEKYSMIVYRGWFTPPVTAKYRFHQSCDDMCDLVIGDTPGQVPEKPVKILDINHWSEYRRVSYSTYPVNSKQTRISKWSEPL